MKYKIKSSKILTVVDPFKKKSGGKPARKFKKDLFVLRTHVYPSNLLISINQTKEELAKSMAKSFKQNSEDQYLTTVLAGDYGARTFWFEGGGIVLHFPNLCDCSFCKGIVAHETFHAVECIFDYIDLKHDKSTSSEAFAYLIGYIVEEIHKKLR